MPTLRELTAESIGRIARRALESQIAQVEAALTRTEKVVAVAPGSDGSAGLVVVLTDARVLVSSAAPFAKPVLEAIPLDEVDAATAEVRGDAWSLCLDQPGGSTVIGGMFDRDAQRIAALLTP